MMKLNTVIAVLVLGLFTAGTAAAFGPHDENCVGCHNLHYAKGDFIIGATPNTSEKNPVAKSNVDGIESLCLGCHNEGEGIIPIHMGTTHPVGVAPTYVKVPAKLLRGGKMSCVSCHNPHPVNSNYKYLVVDTKKGANMGVFCAVCHTDQAPPENVKAAQATGMRIDPAVEPRLKVAYVAPQAKSTKKK